MTDTNGNGSKGVQAYRWILSAGVAVIGVMSMRMLAHVDEVGKDVRTLQIQVTTLNTTIANLALQLANAERRNDAQDAKLNDIERRVWQMAPLPTGRP